MKEFTNIFCISILAISIVGCAGMADITAKMAGLGVISEEKSTFDNATIVNVSPNWLYDPDGSWGNSIKLGARWSSSSAEYIALIMSYGSNTSGGSAFLGLRGVDININGKSYSYQSSSMTKLSDSSYNTVSKIIYTKSQNSVVIPFSQLEEMVQAKDCRIRIHTSDGYEDSRFNIERIPGGSGTAVLSIREFVKRIRSIKGQG